MRDQKIVHNCGGRFIKNGLLIGTWIYIVRIFQVFFEKYRYHANATPCLRSHDLENKCSTPADVTKRSRGTLGIYLKFIFCSILRDAAYKRYFCL